MHPNVITTTTTESRQETNRIHRDNITSSIVKLLLQRRKENHNYELMKEGNSKELLYGERRKNGVYWYELHI